MARKALSKKLRFEVFKRDHFKCQYCGAEAPEAVLHVDHIKPVSKGGTNDVMNLVTACAGCNLGKGARELGDNTVVQKQRAQMDDLAARREQLEMIVDWRDGLEAGKADAIDKVAERIEQRGVLGPSQSGKAAIRKWLREYSLAEALYAVDEAFDIYMKWDGDDADTDAWELAFAKIPGVLRVSRMSKDRPWLKKLFYIQGILRNRLHNPKGNYIQALEEMVTEWVADTSMMEAEAKKATDWKEFNHAVYRQSEAGWEGDD